MKPRNRIYIGPTPDHGDRSPLTRCRCQRLNTLEDYRRNDGKCPKCGELMKLEDE